VTEMLDWRLWWTGTWWWLGNSRDGWNWRYLSSISIWLEY